MLTALAMVGFVPDLPWVERCYRQASKHLHAAAPGDVCSLVWAWGELGYTPRDILFLNQVKIISRRAFDAQELSGPQLMQLMHGLARMPKYAPNAGWLAALCERVKPMLQQISPGETVDLLLLGFKPHPQLLHQLLTALQRRLHLLSSQDLADVGWALCTLKHRPGAAWLKVYLHQAASKAGYMSEQALTDMLWALACFAAEPDREWLKQVLLAAGKLQLTSRNAAVMLWALQQLGFQPQAEGWGLQEGAAGQEVQAAVAGLLQSVLQAEGGDGQQQQQLALAG
ncbi:hypothetical protein OEZ86_000811 [Tetradesmus obliquus]|nr:hypothetical protein OEZ86_000811 [Tetradesmus obliquus]